MDHKSDCPKSQTGETCNCERFFYPILEDFDDVGNMVILSSFTVQHVLDENIKEWGGEAERTKDGVIFGFYMDSELTEMQVIKLDEDISAAWAAYLNTK